MATVPGDPMDVTAATGGIPRELQPGYPELLMAAAMHAQQQQQKLAGDVVRGPMPKDPIRMEQATGATEGPGGWVGQDLDPNTLLSVAHMRRIKVLRPEGDK